MSVKLVTVHEFIKQFTVQFGNQMNWNVLKEQIRIKIKYVSRCVNNAARVATPQI